MKKILSRFGRLSIARAVRDDSVIDQLHHFVTVTAFIGLAAWFTVGKSYPQHVFCWVPAQFNKDHYRDYVNSYCWVTGLYNIPFDEEIPVRVGDRYTQDRSVLYYMWIVVIFLLQAFMFKLPNLIWNLLKFYSGINMTKLLEMTLDIHLVSEEKRTEKLKIISECITRWTSVNRQVKRLSKLKPGCYITRLYLFIKVLYLINVIVQFKFMSSVLGFNYWTYGTEVIRMFTEQGDGVDHFPRTALCDFELRQMQNVHRYTVQCSLRFNVYIEKVVAAEWFVLVLLCLLTMLGLIQCTGEHMYTRQASFIRKYARIMNTGEKAAEKKLFEKFVKKRLMDDGVFVLRIVSDNSSDVLAVELLEIMWLKFCEETENSKQ